MTEPILIDRIAVLQDGEIRQVAEPETILRPRLYRG